MKQLQLMLAIVLAGLSGYGQTLRSDYVIDRNSGGFNELQPKPEVIESVYMTDDWSTGTIVLKSGEAIPDMPIKYDLKNNVLEIKTESGIKIAGFTKLKGFETRGIDMKQTFYNAAELNITDLTGLVEELVKDRVSLYSKPYLEVLPSNYNPALNVGSRNTQYIKKEKILLVRDNAVVDVTRSGKKILGMFGEQSKAMEQFVKENNLSYKNKEDLRKIVERYNELTRS